MALCARLLRPSAPESDTMPSEALSCVLIGSDSLLIECGDMWRSRGHAIQAVITDAPRVAHWARGLGIDVIDANTDYAAALEGRAFDYLFSITFLRIIPAKVLGLPKKAAINFHDGPLPRYAGLNAPTWALIHRERDYGITWHVMNDQVDRGDILKQVIFDINADDTSLSLNTRCFAQAIETFGELIGELAEGHEQRTPQPAAASGAYFGRHARPSAAAFLDWEAPADVSAALVRALDFGPRYPNGLGAPMLVAGSTLYVVTAAEASLSQSDAAPGTLVAIDDAGLQVACGEGTLVIRGLRCGAGNEVSPAAVMKKAGLDVGARLRVFTARDARAVKAEAFWKKRLVSLDPAELPYASGSHTRGAQPQRDRTLSVPPAFSQAFPGEAALCAAFALYLGRISGKEHVALAYSDAALAHDASAHAPLLSPRVPLVVQVEPAPSFADVVARFAAEQALIAEKGGYLANLAARYPELAGTSAMNDPGLLQLGVSVGTPVEAGSLLALRIGGDGARLTYDATRLTEAAAERVQNELCAFLENLAKAADAPVEQVELLSPAARELQLYTWNDTKRPLPAGATIVSLIESQVDRTPHAIAVACDSAQVSFRELDAAANRLAHKLQSLGVGPDRPVGVHVTRSIDLVVAALGVMKAGGAYVPLDPAYPSDRIALMIEDAHLDVVVTQGALVAGLSGKSVRTVALDTDAPELAKLPPTRPKNPATPESLAYLIYTSGSTGKPKGVMLEHRHAVNFFAGMDERVPHGGSGVWLAVTSLSFDISVLELWWTLSHGFKVVVHADRARAQAAASRHAAVVKHRPVEFSFFYFAADATAQGAERYRLLMEGARFADTHGFSAVWTPERHFHAFGGLYPNPAVTGAAVAAITNRVQIRAGSVVLPLHHPVRVAEAWSIVDNISNGRAGIAIASGWQPNDFILMPQNYKDAKRIMMRDIQVVQQLWQGEQVKFQGPNGEDVNVRLMPEPVQKSLPVWITTAGNLETFEIAGASGNHLLTHLLGQSMEKLAPKIEAYRKARAAAGFDPNTGIVSIMLHTFVGEDREEVRELVRGPLKAYLATATDLIKDRAWVFPTFARPKNFDISKTNEDLANLSDEDKDGLYEAAFERYFESSGLFGTPEDALNVVNKLKAIGVDDIACLIDFGVSTELVLRNLPYLDEVRKLELAERAAVSAAAAASVTEIATTDEHPFLVDVQRHGVTHMQCTPSMARMFLGTEETRTALGQIKHVFLGGEALPQDLLNELRQHSACTITNMYGPTETTVWSTTHRVTEADKTVPIGRPIANTTLYVTDEKRRPVPVGVSGELWIGGEGVARGYWERPDLTAERFVADPFSREAGARMYRTGDRARYREDGVMDFLGRADFQVKLRGYRIEPGEIEALVRKLPEVDECVVVLREDRPGDQRLVGYVVPAGPAKVDLEAIREMLRAELPEYMVPAAFMLIESLPLTPNRKIDRKALPVPESRAKLATDEAGAKPESELDRSVAAVWQEVLGRDAPVGLDDNFFDLGGHSLLVVRMHRRLNEALARPIALTDLYRFPTVRSFTTYLSEGSGGDSKKAAARGAKRREMMQRRGG
jgi:natural product biosynthesis luciferase-like monooxygenase protein